MVYFLDGTQNIQKYFKKLPASIILQYNEVEKINARLNVLSKDEQLNYLGRFFYDLNRVVLTKEISCIEKKKFLKDKTVKKAVSKAIRLGLEDLVKCGYSRRDKIWMLLIKLGFYKSAIKLLNKKEK